MFECTDSESVHVRHSGCCDECLAHSDGYVALVRYHRWHGNGFGNLVKVVIPCIPCNVHSTPHSRIRNSVSDYVDVRCS